MPDVSTTEKDILILLSKKIDDQARFTRMLVVICCLALVGSMFYSLSALVTYFPDLVLAKLMGNLETIQIEWHSIEKLAERRAKNKLR